MINSEAAEKKLYQPLWRDYLELCKPNVVALMALTAVVGMLLSVPGMVPLDILLLGNLGIGLCAASAAVDAPCIPIRWSVCVEKLSKTLPKMFL